MIDKFGLEWAIHMNSMVVEELKGDIIWVGWKPSIWKGTMESVSQQYIH